MKLDLGVLHYGWHHRLCPHLRVPSSTLDPMKDMIKFRRPFFGLSAILREYACK